MLSNFLIYSFYTQDDYYVTKAKELQSQLDKMGIEYVIEPIEIPEGKDWSDVCRQKVSKLYSLCKENPDKKVFWIDVDCNILDLPDYVKYFSSDIIGFARGFSSPLKIGYHLRSRFWEPCFIGINCTKAAFKFIQDAAEIEKSFMGKATDDYFFEESWRRNCNNLSYQIIPSSELYNEDGGGFFRFGSSGHVKDFVGKVAQHERLYSQNLGIRGVIKKVLDLFGLLNIARSVNRQRMLFLSKLTKKKGVLTKKLFIELIYDCLDANNLEYFSELEKRRISFKETERRALIDLGNAAFEYQNYNNSFSPIPLCWYPFPGPGNYGDWLSPYILTRITNRSVHFVPFSKLSKYDSKHLLFIGSIIKFATKYSLVFGSGASRKETLCSKEARYLSVRGELTKDVLIRNGVAGASVLPTGDPAVVLPLIYRSKRSDNGRFVLVRHFSHLQIPISLPENCDEISILRSSASDIERFIDQINSYSGVLTSAMHCYITCQAYGIPCAFVTWESAQERIAGDGMKYLDYSSGVGLNPIKINKLDIDMRGVNFNSLFVQEKIPADVMREMYSRIASLSALFK